jgi:hypothetical protein
LILEHLPGDFYTERSIVNEEDINAAIDFFRCLNEDPVFAKKKIRINAAEGFFRITEHIENINSRLSKLTTTHVPKRIERQARDLLCVLQQEIENTSNKIRKMIDRGWIDDALGCDSRCVSPSDFGFHNAVRNKSGVKFFDFEFAGWDDPAKAAADFLLQPRVPVSRKFSHKFMADFYKIIGKNRGQRDAAVASLLRLKWICIMLSPLTSEGLAKAIALNQVPIDTLIEIRVKDTKKYFTQDHLLLYGI